MNNIIMDREKKYKFLELADRKPVDVSLATEDFASFISKVGDFFKSKLNSIKEIFSITANEKQAVGAISNSITNLNSEMKRTFKLSEDVSKKGGSFFSSVDSIIVPTIPGINVDFLTLTKELSSKTDLIINNVKPLLSEIDTYLSKLNNDEDFRTSITPGTIDKKVKEISDSLNVSLTKMIDTKKIDDKTELKNILPNLSSIKDISNNLQNSLITKDLKLLGNIYDLNNNIANKLDNLINLLNKNPKLYISKIRLDEMLNVLKYSSQMITDVSAYIRLTDASYKVFDVIITKLEKIK